MRKICLIGLALLLPTMAAGQGVYLDHVDGLDETGGIVDGATLKFYMRLTNTLDFPIACVNNGFWIHSEGMTLGSIKGYINDDICWTYDEGDPCTPHLWDVGPFISAYSDTIGFSGAVFPEGDGVGLAPGFDDVAYYIEVGPISAADGAYLTLDSCWFPPAHVWEWYGYLDAQPPVVIPEWGGPYTYRPPVYTNTSQEPIILEDLQSNVLEVYVHNEEIDEVDLCSVRVNGNIPPYETECARIVGTDIVTTCWIHRFLGKYQPIDSPIIGEYTVSYMKGDQQVTITGRVYVEVMD